MDRTRSVALIALLATLAVGPVPRVSDDAGPWTPTANDDWQTQALSQLEQQEYFVSRHEDGLQAPNRAHNLRTSFRTGGIDVVPRDVPANETATWQFGWRTSKWGREGQLAAVSTASAEPRAKGARVTYAHDGLDEWYENKTEGLEQGFTVHERPAGAGALLISGEISGGLRPQLSSAEGAVDLVDEHGACALRYGELHVWDARGEELESHLAVDGLEVAIVIDDDGAGYPLTIDPLLTSPAWTAEGVQATANFGYSVATAGDVNGDGFSDVIVGAWKCDNGHTNEGGASVYLGSPNGLSLNASWTAEGEQANANFGNSVASAGDVNGDGYSDVIVGAMGYAATANNRGRAFVYLGSASGLAANARVDCRRRTRFRARAIGRHRWRCQRRRLLRCDRRRLAGEQRSSRRRPGVRVSRDADGALVDAVVDRREQPSVCILRLLRGDGGGRQRRRIRGRDRRGMGLRQRPYGRRGRLRVSRVGGRPRAHSGVDRRKQSGQRIATGGPSPLRATSMATATATSSWERSAMTAANWTKDACTSMAGLHPGPCPRGSWS